MNSENMPPAGPNITQAFAIAQPSCATRCGAFNQLIKPGLEIALWTLMKVPETQFDPSLAEICALLHQTLPTRL
ncbi:hypothetical protein [Rudaea sp.]|uniref:hypothetical protein n=1 Tax=Rudaea sp. TaxID=2136325 RepID=UPI002F9574FF